MYCKSLSDNLEGLSPEEESFLLKFKPFINHKNIIALNDVINNAYYHLERNANVRYFVRCFIKVI